MPLWNDDGSINVTVVDGTSFVGFYAADGSMNIQAAPGSGYCGLMSPAGCYYYTEATPGTHKGFYAPDGSLYVSTTRSDDGPLFVSGLVTNPIVANQTFDMGALTAAGAGGWTPTNSGAAITSASITSGDASGHWQISSAGVLSPSATGATADMSGGTYTLVCSYNGGAVTATHTARCSGTDADGYDRATSYSVATTAELNSAVTAIGTASSGARQILLRFGGDYTSKITISSKAFTNRVTLKAHGNEALPHIRNLTQTALNINTSDNVRLQRLKISVPSSTAVSGQSIVFIQNTCNNFEAISNEIYTEDTNLDYARAIYFANATGCLNAKINNNYMYRFDSGVVNLGANGDVEVCGNIFDLYKADACQASPVAGMTSFKFNDNFLGDSVAADPAHGDGLQFFTTAATKGDWTGIQVNRNIILDNQPDTPAQGLFVTAGGWVKTALIANVNTGTDSVTFTNHQIADGAKVYVKLRTASALPSPLVAGTIYYIKVVDANTIQFSLTDGGAAIDLTTTGTGTNFDIIGAYTCSGESIGNIILVDGFASNSIHVYNAKDWTAENNVVGFPANGTTGQGGIALAVGVDGGGNVIRYNVTCSTPTTGAFPSNGTTISDNIVLGTLAGTIPLADVFVGPVSANTISATTRAEALSRWAVADPGDAMPPAVTVPTGAAGTGRINYATTSPGNDGSLNTPWPPSTGSPAVVLTTTGN